MRKHVGLWLACIIFSSAILCACGGGGGGGSAPPAPSTPTGPFAAGDISGTFGLLNADYVSATYATIDVGGSGSVTGGNFTEIGVGSGTFTGGTLSISTQGAISGSATTSDGDTLTVLDGQMSLDKDVWVYAAKNALGAGESGVLVRVNGSYSTADLQGTWTWGGPASYGTFVIDGSGNITSGTATHIGIGSANITGGTFTISAEGAITGSFITDEPQTYTIQSGGARMNSDKNRLYGAFTYPPGGNGGAIAIKQSGSFTPGADVAGTWTFITCANSGNDVLYGSIIIDNTGTITGENLTEIGFGSATFVGGVLSLSTQGIVTGSALTSTGKTYTIQGQSGQMNSTKDVFTFVAEDYSNGQTGVSLFIKTP